MTVTIKTKQWGKPRTRVITDVIDVQKHAANTAIITKVDDNFSKREVVWHQIDMEIKVTEDKYFYRLKYWDTCEYGPSFKDFDTYEQAEKWLNTHWKDNSGERDGHIYKNLKGGVYNTEHNKTIKSSTWYKKGSKRKLVSNAK